MNSLSQSQRAVLLFGLLGATLLMLVGCGGDGGAGTQFAGTIDTLPGGRIVVANPEAGIWAEGDEWDVVEELRLGSLDGTGPDVFGAISVIEVDAEGRFYAFERQAQELRVFAVDGSHVRTLGRKGGGPGEFEQVIGMDWAPDGNLWVVDPGNSRISVFDTAGTYVDSHRTLGGFIISPWPGGFDDLGQFYNYGVDTSNEDGFAIVLVRFDDQMEPVDSVAIPRWQGKENFFELVGEGGHSRMRTTVPFSPGLTSKFVRGTRHIWFALTGEYEIYQTSMAGDTVRVISRAFDPLPVTGEDMDSALVRLKWFTDQGGEVDRSKIPNTKPGLQQFYVDDRGQIFVTPVTERALTGRVLDVFDAEGRYLGRLELPFQLRSYPTPIFRDGKLYATTIDEFEVPYLVRADLGQASTVERGRARELSRTLR